MDHQPDHVPVMVREVLVGLDVQNGQIILDATTGAGGHAKAILQQSAPSGQLIGLDRDPAALETARQILTPYRERCKLMQANFSDFDQILAHEGIGQLDAILLDLGVSSMQLDTGPRGFSFRHEGPLDMRMNPADSRTAAHIINQWPDRELADLFYRFGEEHFSRRYARAVVQAREQGPIRTTRQLADIIHRAQKRTWQEHHRLHPATRVFQALRIAVNEELGELEIFLNKFSRALKPNGRVAVISYHSLEDRLVKQAFRQGAKEGTLKILTKKPLQPEPAEVDQNPRARSAKLRLAQKIREEA